jgi:hypothetical protein
MTERIVSATIGATVATTEVPMSSVQSTPGGHVAAMMSSRAAKTIEII